MERREPGARAADGTPDEMAEAIEEVRREGRKVAFIYAAVDAALVVVGTLFVAAILGLDPQIGLPGAIRGPIADLTGIVITGEIGASRIAGVVLGFLTFAAQYARRTEQPLVDQFEQANPQVRERLRTARDAVRDGEESVMARRLYAEVLDRLRQTSSLRLVDQKRVGTTIFLILLLGVGSVFVVTAGIGFDLGGGGEEAVQERDYEGLQDPNRILGEEEDVESGEQTLDAKIGTSGEGQTGGNESVQVPRAYSDGASGDVEAQQAGFDESDQVANADLIREYNLRIRQEGS